ncbi:hypothetical protein BJY01DRAFT_246150 [Aspergillus pseudoustus]|uniref:AAA+ ATPase domain-containing protein n=1 Tax=Aspergillus pseudoustus TaxID=1810923 RepID=A0ABR4K9G3_9EURO
MRPKTRKEFTVAIICALPIEADAVEAVFDEQYDRLGKFYGKQPGDMNVYINGRIGKHNVVLCYMPGKGKGSAAGVTSSLLISYTGIELGLVVGICGGGPSPPEYRDIFLGDVVISDSVIEYDFGRQYPGGFQRKTDVQVQDTLRRPGRKIWTLLNGLRADNSRSEFQTQTQQYLQTLQQTGAKWQHPRVDDNLFDVSYLHKHYSHASSTGCDCACLISSSPDQICKEALGQSCHELKCSNAQAIRCRKFSDEAIHETSVYIGPVASADTVMMSGQHRDEIVRREGVIGFEMEGPGVWDNVPCIVIKGVCDYADSHKNKEWQPYAAGTGASAAKAFLEYWVPANGGDASAKRHLMIPFQRNLRFVGRQSEIRHLEDLITMPDGPKKVAIAGLGGVGKTQIALELAYRMRDREQECSIFWVPCTSYEAVEQAFLTIAEKVEIKGVKPANVKERLVSYLGETNKKWLLIFDNADDREMWTEGSSDQPPLSDFVPSHNEGHVVFTTRNRELAVDLASTDVLHVHELDEKSGVEFLEKSLLRKVPHARNAMVDLLEQLAFLPLAISQATAYINKKGITVTDYLTLLQEQETDVVELLSKDFSDDRRYRDAQNPVAKTWLISFSQIEKLNGLAAEYLQLMACVSPRDIPRSFLPEKSTLEMVDAFGLLSAYSLITINPANQDITLHRLVHLATRNWLRKENRYESYITKTADRMLFIFPNNKHFNRQLWRAYLPHAMPLLGDEYFQSQEEDYIDFVQNVGACLYSEARYAESERLLAHAAETRTRVLGPKHTKTLTSMNNIVQCYMYQGKWKKAEELEARALETRKDVLGREHPNTLTSMGNLASIYSSQGKWDAAEELGAQVVELKKQVLGPEHPDTLIIMSNLVPNYQSQGRWKEAEELGLQVLEARKRVLGSHHPDTLTSMALLAFTYQNQLRLLEAEELERQTLDARKQVLGPEDHDTLVSMGNLAIIYQYQQRWKESEQLAAQVLETQKRVLGPRHPITLGTMHVLAYTWKELGRTSQALALMQECANLRMEVLGSDHPHVKYSFQTLSDWTTALTSSSKEKAQHIAKEPPRALRILSYLSRNQGSTSSGLKPVTVRNRRGLISLFRRE